MYSRPADRLTDVASALEASDLIRACVHCGFCLPACPTYRVTGNELDSPRGRIYLVKELIEQGSTNATARTHLDRCLTCRACETACPSGVQYGRLVDLGRELIEREPPAPRRPAERVIRSALTAIATRRALFGPLLRVGQLLRPMLPCKLRALVAPPLTTDTAAAGSRTWPPARHERRLAVLEGCVQPGLAPQINAAAARVLDRIGVSLVPARGVGCCGAMQHHLGQTDAAVAQVRRNVAASLRLLDGRGSGGTVAAIVSSASGCGVFAKDYGHALRHASDPQLIAQAKRVSAATRDLCEVIDPVAVRNAIAGRRAANGAPVTAESGPAPRVAWQAPCSLQHGQRQSTAGKVEALLLAAGCELVAVRDPTMCCGSAGTYSVLQPELARELRSRKLESLLVERPDVIATANIGCQEHLRQASDVPVRHWIELVDAALNPT